MTPRQYQLDCLTATEKAFCEFNRVLDVLPTGAGKTCLFSWLAQRRQQRGERTLILAHRDELIDQAIAKLHAATGIIADKEKAEFRASLSAPVVVASIQTMARRLDRWPAQHFGLVVADEAHRCLAASWQSTLNHFDAQILGVTATPMRSDQRDLGSFFQTKAYEISLKTLINDGYLAPIMVRELPLRIDMSGVEIQMDSESGQKDFSRAQTAVRLEPYLSKFAECLRDHAAFRRTLVFVPMVQTAQKGVEACRSIGIDADWVSGEDPDRKSKLERFRDWEFDVLWNADLLKEGYDDPGIDCVAVFRPTKAYSLYWQCLGRGTRIHPGKQNLLVLECLYLNTEHQLADAYTLIATDDFEAQQMRELAGNGKPMPAGVAEECDLVGLQIQAESQREKALIKRLEQVKANDPKLITPEEFGLLHRSLIVSEHQDVMPSDSAPVTKTQKDWLDKVRVDPKNGKIFLRYAPASAKPLDVDLIKTRGHASKILDVCFNEKNRGVAWASSKQVEIMRRRGYPHDHATADQARRFFADLRKPKQQEMVI